MGATFVLRWRADATGPALYYPPHAIRRAEWSSEALARAARAGLFDGADWEVVPEESGAMSLNIAPDLAADIRVIAARLVTQDNRITDCPIFLVEEKRRTYGFDPAYSDHVVWRDVENDYAEAGPAKRGRLEALFRLGGDVPAKWTRTAYQDTWEYVTACFTEAGCQEYIRVNKHNHRGELRIYAATSWRNAEFRAVRDLLAAIAGAAS